QSHLHCGGSSGLPAGHHWHSKRAGMASMEGVHAFARPSRARSAGRYAFDPQVNADDAVRSQTGQDTERLRADLTSKGIAFTSLAQPDPKGHPERITVQGI